ncbi:MAG: signal peptidase II [Actinomycetota bacterium]|nr:signal peptidase II [Actinomycetota bacterium]
MTDPAAPELEPAPAHPRRTNRLVGAFALIAVLVFAADQLSKTWALANLTEGSWQELLGDWIQLTLVFNPGAALSLGTGITWLLTLLAVGVTIFVLRSARKLGSRGWTVALGLLLGGALGNLFDRFFRDPGFARGHVVDFIDYFGWFVGNVADIAIVVAAGLLMILSVRGIRLDGSREPADKAPEPDSAS